MHGEGAARMKAGRAVVLQGNALALPLKDESVDLVITSPPYFALRSYQDEGEHYEGQIGSEPTPREFLDALVAQMRESVRVLKPTGSIFVNLGDKYAGTGGHNNAGLQAPRTGAFGDRTREKAKATATRRNAPDHYTKSSEVAEGVNVRAKSLLGLPWRFALRCVDELGLILRQEIIWAKPNGLPESVDDRCRRSHEQWFHFVTEGRYHTALDEIRTPHVRTWGGTSNGGRDDFDRGDNLHTTLSTAEPNPLGALPPSVWPIATEPLRVPEFAIEDERGWRMFGKPATNKVQAERARRDLWEYCERRHIEGCQFLRLFEPDHFAAFPTEWPRKLVLGWAPNGICSVCGEPRRPVSEKTRDPDYRPGRKGIAASRGGSDWHPDHQHQKERLYRTQATILGYACDCTPYTDHGGTKATGRSHKQGVDAGTYSSQDFGGQYANRPKSGKWREYHFDKWTPPETRPAVVLDPFAGTGTVPMIAKALGHLGIGVDLSLDYVRLARWRCQESGHEAKAVAKTWGERQGLML